MELLQWDSLVNVDWLHRHLGHAQLRILDASWHLPNSGRSAHNEFVDAHIPGAVFFDIDRIADPCSDLPHMLPDTARFGAEVGALGVSDDSMVAVYDTHGLFAAARAWWMLRAFGHPRVAILDGGLPAWRARGLPLAQGRAQPAPAEFSPRLDPGQVRSLAQMLQNLDTRAEQVIDARPAGRFAGTTPEPRPRLASGHIPGSSNIAFTRVTDDTTRCMLPVDELGSLFRHLDDRPVVCSCGTGVSACVLAFALHRLGRNDVAVYDGSWAEWASRNDTPIERDAADP